MIYRDRLEKTRERLKALEAELSRPETIREQALFQKLSKELARIRPLVNAYEAYLKTEKELQSLAEELETDDPDEELKELYAEEKKRLDQERTEHIARIEKQLLKESDPLTGRDVIMEIRAGTGGEEAALFAADLFRMYSRFAQIHGLKVELIEVNETGIGGFKEIIFGVSGTDAYSLFKYERGIHRVQRVPETESSGRIHTSAVTVALMAEADASEVEIDPGDLKIDVFRASGAGGQHVNKTESAVRITHVPTGVVVSCQDERSQHKNKAKAMRVLRARLYEAEQERRQKEQARQRKVQVGTGDRSGKIRTYNFHEQRVTDHRIGLTLHSLNDILNGHLDELVGALEQDERQRRLKEAA